MNVASITFTMLNFTPSSVIMPRIHTQLMAMGRKASTASSTLPKENHRNRKTIMEHAQPM